MRLGVPLVHLALYCTTLQLDPSWVLHVRDGDTFVIRNAGITNTEPIRVCQDISQRKAVCVNTPETDAPDPAEKLHAAAATAFTESWLMAGPFTLAACERDSFGRLLGVVTRADSNLGQALLDEGHATIYKRKPKVTPP